MRRKLKKNNIKIFLIIAAVLVINLINGDIAEALAARFPLEIVNIKPSGTGDPAIHPNNRIFKAFPGVEYNIRAAVLGGEYPFTFNLNNEPTGMVVNSISGEISWPNPQNSTAPITLSVTDSEGTVVSTTWSIDVNTNGFLFVDHSYAGVELGTLGQPYNSISDIVGLDGHSTDIVYFRAGMYSLPVSNPIYYLNNGCNLAASGGRPHKWIGYPREDVTIDMQDHYLETEALSSHYYFDNLNFVNMNNWGIRNTSSNNYFTVRRCDFSGVTNNYDGNHNQGIIYTHRELLGSFLVIQDNKAHDYHTTAAFGNTYMSTKILIEDNEIYNQTTDDVTLSNIFGLKGQLSYVFVRHNYVHDIVAGSVMTNVHNDLHDVEFSFNYFDAPAVDDRFNMSVVSSSNVYFYRNTLVLGIIYMEITDDTDGPFYFINNVIVNDNNTSYTDLDHTSYHYTCNMSGTPPFATTKVIQIDNLKGLPSSNIVDSNGHLTEEYSQFLGVRGWEIASVPSPVKPAVPRDFTN